MKNVIIALLFLFSSLSAFAALPPTIDDLILKLKLFEFQLNTEKTSPLLNYITTDQQLKDFMEELNFGTFINVHNLPDLLKVDLEMIRNYALNNDISILGAIEEYFQLNTNENEVGRKAKELKILHAIARQQHFEVSREDLRIITDCARKTKNQHMLEMLNQFKIEKDVLVKMRNYAQEKELDVIEFMLSILYLKNEEKEIHEYAKRHSMYLRYNPVDVLFGYLSIGGTKDVSNKRKRDEEFAMLPVFKKLKTTESLPWVFGFVDNGNKIDLKREDVSGANWDCLFKALSSEDLELTREKVVKKILENLDQLPEKFLEAIANEIRFAVFDNPTFFSDDFISEIFKTINHHDIFPAETIRLHINIFATDKETYQEIGKSANDKGIIREFLKTYFSKLYMPSVAEQGNDEFRIVDVIAHLYDLNIGVFSYSTKGLRLEHSAGTGSENKIRILHNNSHFQKLIKFEEELTVTMQVRNTKLGFVEKFNLPIDIILEKILSYLGPLEIKNKFMVLSKNFRQSIGKLFGSGHINVPPLQSEPAKGVRAKRTKNGYQLMINQIDRNVTLSNLEDFKNNIKSIQFSLGQDEKKYTKKGMYSLLRLIKNNADSIESVTVNEIGENGFFFGHHDSLKILKGLIKDNHLKNLMTLSLYAMGDSGDYTHQQIIEMLGDLLASIAEKEIGLRDLRLIGWNEGEFLELNGILPALEKLLNSSVGKTLKLLELTNWDMDENDFESLMKILVDSGVLLHSLWIERFSTKNLDYFKKVLNLGCFKELKYFSASSMDFQGGDRKTFNQLIADAIEAGLLPKDFIYYFHQ